MVSIHGLGEVIARASTEAFLAVAFHRFGGDGEDGQITEFRGAADLAHGFVAVHLGHHEVHEHEAESGRLLDQINGAAAAGRGEHFHSIVLQHGSEGEDVAGVVIDDEHFAPAQCFVGHVRVWRSVEPPRGRCLCRQVAGIVGAGVMQRHKEREGAALSVDAVEIDFAAEQRGQFAADGEAEAGATIFARGAGVGLLEGLEDVLLLLRSDADAGVLDGEADDSRGLAEYGVVRAPAGGGHVHAHFHFAVRGEFHGVGEQVLENLLEPLRVAVHGLRQVGGELHAEGQVLCLGDVPEVPVDGVAQLGEGDLLDVDADGAGLELGKVENVVDEVVQVFARRVDVARKLDLLGS